MKMQHQPNRIRKTEAKKLWDAGEPFVIVPRLIYPYDAQGNLKDFAFIVDSFVKSNYKSFDRFCDHYIYYNCNSITGLYPAFYILTTERNGKND